MIVVAEEGRLLLITQPDHARFAAQLLALWRRPEVAEHPRRTELIEAVREHDNGWREADAAPRVDPATGRPFDFRSLPEAPRRELWLRGIERFAVERPYVALLAAQHARELHRQRAALPGWRQFLARVGERRDELLSEAGLERSALEADYRWLELADTLSLMACCRATEPLTRGRLTARWRAGRLELEPFPLAGATTFELPCRRLPDRRYHGESDLAGELGAAHWERLRVSCRPAAP